jgi:hypothetical protein
MVAPPKETATAEIARQQAATITRTGCVLNMVLLLKVTRTKPLLPGVDSAVQRYAAIAGNLK